MVIIEMYVMNRMDMFNVLNRCSQVQIILQAQSKVRLVVHLDCIKSAFYRPFCPAFKIDAGCTLYICIGNSLMSGQL